MCEKNTDSERTRIVGWFYRRCRLALEAQKTRLGPQILCVYRTESTVPNPVVLSLGLSDTTRLWYQLTPAERACVGACRARCRRCSGKVPT